MSCEHLRQFFISCCVPLFPKLLHINHVVTNSQRERCHLKVIGDHEREDGEQQWNAWDLKSRRELTRVGREAARAERKHGEGVEEEGTRTT